MANKKPRLIVLAFSECIRIVRPLLGPDGMCIFTPYTCTQYAFDQLENMPVYRAIPLIIWRVMRCNPLTRIWHAFTQR